MSERLSDEELADVAHRVADGRCHVCKADRERIALMGCDACEGTGAFSLATGTMERVLMELIELRALRLTAADREALSALAFLLHKHSHEPYAYDGEECAAGIAVLSKLLSQGGTK